MNTGPSPTASPPSQAMAERWKWIGLAMLVLAVALSYAPAAGHEFVTYDDPEYIYENPPVRDGISTSSLVWALTAFHSSNWHPLTWLSHMLDCELFGLDAGMHHAVGVALHGLNACLLMLVLLQASRARSRAPEPRRFPAFLVAALFALHPLRVESVAWASERKDLLAALFLFSLLLAYGRYLRTGSRRAWLGSIFLFACGLASKPMLITVPILLCMLELWPFQREPAERGSWVTRLHVTDKLPFFGLSLASVVVTLLSQSAGGALRSVEGLPLDARFSNAAIAATGYLAKSLLPRDLAFFHPHPALTSPSTYAAWSASFFVSAVALVGISLAAFRLRSRTPALTFGWFAYLLLLSPVIGLVQVGEQSWAERYAYLPLIGVYIAIVYPLADALRTRALACRSVAALALVLLVVCAGLTHQHVKTWRSSSTLYEHALTTTRHNYLAHHLLANVRAEEALPEQAEAHYLAALEIRPGYAPAHYGLGLLHQSAGELELAIASYRSAVEHDPKLAQAWLNLGSSLAASWQSGPPAARTSARLLEAQAAFERTLENAPRQPEALYNLGGLALMAGELERAIDYLERAARSGGGAQAYEMLATAYEQLGRVADAEEARGRAKRARGDGRP